ncbi:MAG: ATP-binding protein [Clostridia bacterium]|nr:ATP-binding protein [Clostridia bacterium]
MDNRIMQEVLSELSQQRSANEREEMRRRTEVTEKCPEIGEIMVKRQQSVLASIYSAFALPPEENLEEKVLAWNAQIKLLLKQNGYPENYLEPVCRCKACEDTGYVGESKKTLCACAQALYAKHLEKGGVFEQEQSFENYDENVFPDTPLPGTDVTQRRYMAVIRRRCEEYANALPHPAQKTLLLYGGSGLGKTYLLRAIHTRAREMDIPALCMTANTFLRTAREAYFSRDQQGLDALYETPLLLIDDLGTEPLLENITVEQLFNLINERQNARLCTVLSTNLSLTELKARYTERVLSRLLDKRSCQTLHFLGEDIRLR